MWKHTVCWARDILGHMKELGKNSIFNSSSFLGIMLIYLGFWIILWYFFGIEWFIIWILIGILYSLNLIDENVRYIKDKQKMYWYFFEGLDENIRIENENNKKKI